MAGARKLREGGGGGGARLPVVPSRLIVYVCGFVDLLFVFVDLLATSTHIVMHTRTHAPHTHMHLQIHYHSSVGISSD